MVNSFSDNCKSVNHVLFRQAFSLLFVNFDKFMGPFVLINDGVYHVLVNKALANYTCKFILAIAPSYVQHHIHYLHSHSSSIELSEVITLVLLNLCSTLESPERGEGGGGKLRKKQKFFSDES